uniref:Uncharacterized protein n=1 Tax=Trichuris muris TaxID=70415 RepID=A0A5S6QBQ4_TRIMR
MYYSRSRISFHRFDCKRKAAVAMRRNNSGCTVRYNVNCAQITGYSIDCIVATLRTSLVIDGHMVPMRDVPAEYHDRLPWYYLTKKIELPCMIQIN